MNTETELTHLTWEFQAWCQANRMPEEGDAEALLGVVTEPAQRAWLMAFSRRWEEAESANTKAYLSGFAFNANGERVRVVVPEK